MVPLKPTAFNDCSKCVVLFCLISFHFLLLFWVWVTGRGGSLSREIQMFLSMATSTRRWSVDCSSLYLSVQHIRSQTRRYDYIDCGPNVSWCQVHLRTLLWLNSVLVMNKLWLLSTREIPEGECHQFVTTCSSAHGLCSGTMIRKNTSQFTSQ